MAGPRAWSFLTIDGMRQYGGNAGYVDNPAEVYRYDSDVANHKQVADNDVIVLRSKTGILGVAKIEKVFLGLGEKERQRCPHCHATYIKERTTMHPRWACKNKHTFDSPVREIETVRTFEAHYGQTFRPAPRALTLTQLNAAVIRPSDQMSIKELDLACIEEWFWTDADCRQLIVDFAGSITLETSTRAYDGIAAPTSIIEARRRVLREVSIRRGQAKFRERLIRRYGQACQISRCAFAGLVEAAHIRPYALSNENSPHNGLLLRSDLHTLFDLGLLAIDPASMSVALHPDLRNMGYAPFDGQQLFTNGTSGPDRGALEERWEFFCNFASSSASSSE